MSAVGEPEVALQPALIRRLLEEHRRLLPALEAWVRSSPQEPAQAARERLEQLADALRRHAALEERILFEVVGKVLGSQGLVGYEMQHDDIEELLETLLGAAPGLPPDFAALADRLLWICEAHFETEERHLFPEAVARLPAEVWGRLEAQVRDRG